MVRGQVDDIKSISFKSGVRALSAYHLCAESMCQKWQVYHRGRNITPLLHWPAICVIRISGPSLFSLILLYSTK